MVLEVEVGASEVEELYSHGPNQKIRQEVEKIWLLTVTVHDGYTGSVTRHPYRPVGPLRLSFDGTAYAVPYTVIPVKITAVYGRKPYYTAVKNPSKWGGTQAKLI
ncbi:hypothetical protein B0H14DRAFT_2599797 [Mycena olivaceomarginata]|nr:hypothetical protein B0H14DRAFT_2599797 [Mycena olivaceomarginata]